MEILPENIESAFSTFRAKCFSPYFNRYNQIILRTTDFGLLKEFYEEDLQLQSSRYKPEAIEKEKVLTGTTFRTNLRLKKTKLLNY